MSNEAKPVTYYIVGEEDALGATATPPRIVRDAFKPKRWRMLWLASAAAEVRRWEFPIVRGRAEEFRTYDYGKRVYARELPADAVPELLRHDEAVRAAEEALKAAKAERRAFLAAQAPRAIVARVPAGNEPPEEK